MDYKRPRKQTPGLVQAHQVQTSEPYCAQSDEVTKPRPGDCTSPKTLQELYLKTRPTEPGLQTRICHNLSERSASDQTPLGYRIRVLKAGKGSKLQPTGLSTALSRAQLHANSKTGLNPKEQTTNPTRPTTLGKTYRCFQSTS